MDGRETAKFKGLRGMIALRTGELDGAQRAFDKLAKQRGSRLAREAPWRLADVAWARGDPR